jgi:hypothetical protein
LSGQPQPPIAVCLLFALLALVFAGGGYLLGVVRMQLEERKKRGLIGWTL